MKKVLSLIVLTLLILLTTSLILAEETNKKSDLENQIREYEQKLNETRQQKNTLASQIELMDTQIYLTNLRIQDTEEKIIQTGKEIELLSSRIDGLDTSLDYLSKLLLSRIVEGYKNKQANLMDMMLDSNNANELINRAKYLKQIESNNQKILIQVQTAKLNFEEQKNLREKKKEDLNKLEQQLEVQKQDLGNQKAAKQSLLETTKNDERIYQTLLAKAKAEYAAIQGIVAGAGTEEKIRDVTKGETIAVIATTGSGAYCNTTGPHLHFIVKEGGTTINPFNKLKSIDYRNYSGDPFNPSGDWDWPLSPQIQFNQGYGYTSFVQTSRWYPFHDGIDISGSSYSVYAVSDGILYRGSYSGSGGCALPYVKLIHKDSNYSTFYLHTYSQ